MSVIHKFSGKKGTFEWEGVKTHEYPNERAKDVFKRVMIGTGDGASNFEIRYFEVAPGGYTSLDKHAHDHGVVIVRGRGRLLLGEKKNEVDYGDTIYISPRDTHQFENPFDEPLGFICVIPARR